MGPSPGIPNIISFHSPSLHTFGRGLMDYIGGGKLTEGRILVPWPSSVGIHTAVVSQRCGCLCLNPAPVSISSLMLLQAEWIHNFTLNYA